MLPGRAIVQTVPFRTKFSIHGAQPVLIITGAFWNLKYKNKAYVDQVLDKTRIHKITLL